MSDHQERYNMVAKTRQIPRKTYLSGFLRGKYWGEAIIDHEAQHGHASLYDFHIYEAEVSIVPSVTCTCITPLKPECCGLHMEAEGKFDYPDDSAFSRERLPQLLPIIVKKDGKEYVAAIYEPRLAEVQLVSQLHQTDGKEIFGTIEAHITGFLLDFIPEEYFEPEDTGNKDPGRLTAVPPLVPPLPAIEASAFTTYRATYPRRWTRRRYHTYSNGGCITSISGALMLLIGISFLVLMLPKLMLILPFIIVPLIFRLIPTAILEGTARLMGILLCIGFFMAILHVFKHQPHMPPKRPVVQQHSMPDTIKQGDTLIRHYLRWKDYDGHYYQGEIQVKRSDLRAATQFKRSLIIAGNTMQGYDEMIYRLKEHDKDHLDGIYGLFDSIRTAKQLPADKFAELIVSFVQNIPYAVILPDACDASLYSDQFIRKYLTTPDARCDGYERFGINTPVEFMTNLNGDCDTRTLLLYTLLSHYRYDVALLSSEYYNHSLIGIDLPYSGTAFVSDTKRYVLWETTSAGIRPGILPDELSNLDYWRISLKSE